MAIQRLQGRLVYIIVSIYDLKRKELEYLIMFNIEKNEKKD